MRKVKGRLREEQVTLHDRVTLFHSSSPDG